MLDRSSHEMMIGTSQGLEPWDDPKKAEKCRRPTLPTCQAKEKARKMRLGVSGRDDLRLDDRTDPWSLCGVQGACAVGAKLASGCLCWLGC